MHMQLIQSTLETIPFADLYLSEINPRTVVSEAGIEALAENIRALGLIQNLAGLRDDNGKVGIVAGGRRLRALALLQGDVRFQTVAVQIAPDAETATIWAASENNLRQSLHPADEVREFGRMAGQGASVPDIALAFGVSEAHVYRRLKLAALDETVLDALKADDITLGAAAAFTICDDAKLVQEVLAEVRGRGVSDARIKQMLKPDAVRSTDRRAIFVGEEAYRAAGGRLSADLFADITFFDDPDILDRCMEAALEQAARDVASAQGWTWVEAIPHSYLCSYSMGLDKYGRVYPVEGVLSEDQSERFDALGEAAEKGDLDAAQEAEFEALHAILDGDYTEDQRGHAGAFVYVTSDGALKIGGGYVKPEDKAAAIEAGVMSAPYRSGGAGAADTPKSPISAKLADDLNRIATGARQSAALADTDLLVDLLAYQLSHDVLWRGPVAISTDDVPNMPSTEGSGYVPDARITESPKRDMYGKDLAKSFRAFRKKGPVATRALLAQFIAQHLRTGDETLAGLIDKTVGTDIRAVWTPNAENFFKRVGGPYLNALWCALLGIEADHPTATTFAKLKKAEKADKLEALFAGDAALIGALGLSETQIDTIAKWLPEGMA